MEINYRLKQIRKEFGLSQAKFALKFNLPQSTYAQYEKGGRAIPDNLKLVLSQFGINMNWLIAGKGNMYFEENSIGNKSPKNEQYGSEIDTHVSEKGSSYYKKTDNINSSYWSDTKGQTTAISVSKDSFSVPILKNKVSAGPGEEWDLVDFSEERLPILKKFVRRFPQEKLFSAEVRGDSMTGVQLFDGDLVVFVSKLIEGDAIYVISVDGELLVKRLEFDHFDKKLIIKSENPRYEVKIIDPERAQILGKVVGWLHHHPY